MSKQQEEPNSTSLPVTNHHVQPVNTSKLLRETGSIGPDDKRTLLTMERTVFETRLNNPWAFNILVFNIVMGSAYLSGVLRKRRVPPQHTKANILTLTSSFTLFFCYMRNLIPSFEKKHAMEPRREALTPEGWKRWEERKKKLSEQ